VYPALVVLQHLQKIVNSHPDMQVLWVGGSGGMEVDLVKRAGVPFTSIPAAGLHGVGLRALPVNLWQLGRGFKAARAIIRQFQPDVLFFTGGYIGIPVALAAKMTLGKRSRPNSLVYVPDIEPGLALKTLIHLSDHVAVTTESSRQFMPHHKPITVTGYPVRSDLLNWDKESARQVFGITPNLPVLFVTGGSRGARSINQALIGILPDILKDMQVIHVSGQLNWSEIETARLSLPVDLAVHYHAYPYLHAEMGAALSVADIVLSRAGASSLGEYPLFGLPAILVPYPHAWRYQRVNAEYLVTHGAAVLLEDADLPQKLLSTLRMLVKDRSLLDKMGKAMRSLAQSEASATLGRLVLGLSKSNVAKGSETWSA
jgi:UDP-N-acetylglucosamine--N-acetylmuramyl-(pentapeptide) pyrophosphoryl-undecaprenol N-acetylglucosamine transferase